MKYLRKISMACVLALMSKVAVAMPMVTTADCASDLTQQCAIGITDLVIMGTLFDVSFSQQSYDELFAGDDPYFLGNLADAQVARNAIAAALGANELIDIPGPSALPSLFLVPIREVNFGLPTHADHVFSQRLGGVWSTPLITLGIDRSLVLAADASVLRAYASFTPRAAEVPLPATLALFGLGLVGLGWSRRKKA